MDEKKKRMETLVNAIVEAQSAFKTGNPKLSDREYNNAMLELVRLEFELGTKLPNSPTQADEFIESLGMLEELSNGKGEE